MATRRPVVIVNGEYKALPVGDTIDVAAVSQNLFQTIAVSGQSDVVADSTSDTLTLVAGSGVTITTNAGTDTITFTASSADPSLISRGKAEAAIRNIRMV